MRTEEDAVAAVAFRLHAQGEIDREQLHRAVEGETDIYGSASDSIFEVVVTTALISILAFIFISLSEILAFLQSQNWTPAKWPFFLIIILGSAEVLFWLGRGKLRSMRGIGEIGIGIASVVLGIMAIDGHKQDIAIQIVAMATGIITAANGRSMVQFSQIYKMFKSEQ